MRGTTCTLALQSPTCRIAELVSYVMDSGPFTISLSLDSEKNHVPITDFEEL
jgi:hypothetical protein